MRSVVVEVSGGVLAGVAVMTVAIVIRAQSLPSEDTGADFVVHGRETAMGEAELPVWFGDTNRPVQRIVGHVFGATPSTVVHLVPELPDLRAAYERRAVVDDESGDFALGAIRPGRYLLFATGDHVVSRVSHIDTLDRASVRDLEIYAYDLSLVGPRVRDKLGDLDPEWELSVRIASGASLEAATSAIMQRVDADFAQHQTWTQRKPPEMVAGFVQHSDGSPAPDVGVEPVECPTTSESWPEPLPTVVTTSPLGSFHVPGDKLGFGLCGLRIWNGRQVYDVAYRDPPRMPVVVRLPIAGAEPFGVFEEDRVAPDDPRGRWIRGRVVRGERPVADIGVRAAVETDVRTLDAGSTRTRRDGTFELFVSVDPSNSADEVRLGMGNELLGLFNSTMVRLPRGSSLERVTFEVGAPVPVSGVIVGERGEPLAGIQLGCGWARSEPSDVAGRFHLTVWKLGVCDLKVLGHATAQLLSPRQIETPKLDTEVHGLQVVVFIPPSPLPPP